MLVQNYEEQPWPSSIRLGMFKAKCPVQCNLWNIVVWAYEVLLICLVVCHLFFDYIIQSTKFYSVTLPKCIIYLYAKEAKLTPKRAIKLHTYDHSNFLIFYIQCNKSAHWWNKTWVTQTMISVALFSQII